MECRWHVGEFVNNVDCLHIAEARPVDLLRLCHSPTTRIYKQLILMRLFIIQKFEIPLSPLLHCVIKTLYHLCQPSQGCNMPRSTCHFYDITKVFQTHFQPKLTPFYLLTVDMKFYDFIKTKIFTSVKYKIKKITLLAWNIK